MEFTSHLKNFFSFIANNRGQLFLIGSSLFLVVIFLYYFYIPPATDIGPEQPIPFSHRIHSGVKEIQCQFCHPYVSYSRYPGLPPVEKCLYCHKYIIPKHPQVQKEHWYFNNRKSTPWVEINYVPEHALFNHQRHIRKEITCQECHGAVETMDRLKRKRFLMGFCVKCHQKKEANLDCWACHS